MLRTYTCTREKNGRTYTYSRHALITGRRLTRDQIIEIEPTIIQIIEEYEGKPTIREVHERVLEAIAPLKCSKSLVQRYMREDGVRNRLRVLAEARAEGRGKPEGTPEPEGKPQAEPEDKPQAEPEG
jgi:hypothetical protein